MPFHDHSSKCAATYAAARLDYPTALFAWSGASLPGARELAWDAGCGNGQAANALAGYFEHVVATDSSAAQLAEAIPPYRAIDYRTESAELPTLPTGSVDLITVAQALHWFDVDDFYTTVKRVLRHDGILAVWCYGHAKVEPSIDAVTHRLHHEVLGPYWPPERAHVENGYRELGFPFMPICPPEFVMEGHWTLSRYLDYLHSWSASQRYWSAQGNDAVQMISPELSHAWGNPEHTRIIRWPLTLMVGYR